MRTHHRAHPSGPTVLRGRREFLRRAGLLGIGAALAGACGDDGGAGGEQADDSRYLVAAFPDGFRTPAILVAGTEVRAPLVVVDQLGPLTREAPSQIDITVSGEGGEIGTFAVARHGEGLTVPYYPLRFTPSEPGAYRAQASFSDLPVEFRVVAEGETRVVQVGEAMRPLATPTTTATLGVDPVCTRTPEPCPLHALSLDEALAAGGPVALYIGTPAFCQTAVCGPILEFLLDELPDRPELTVVHAEVYVDPYGDAGTSEVTEVIDVYGLDFEPQLVVADGAGTVTAVLNNSMDRAELAAALDTATA